MTKLSITAMHCQNCIRHIQKVFAKAGLNVPTFDVEHRSLETDVAVDALPALLKALEEAGYPATVSA